MLKIIRDQMLFGPGPRAASATDPFIGVRDPSAICVRGVLAEAALLVAFPVRLVMARL